MELKQTGKFIAQLRKEKELTQQELAEKLNVTDKAVSRWETGRGLPDADSMLALSNLFGVTINELLLGKRISTPDEAKEEGAKIAVEYVKTLKKEKYFKAFAIIAVIWGVISYIFKVILIAAVCIAAVLLYKCVMGTSDCVIAKDYSCIVLYGKKYIPFDIEDNTCSVGMELIKEAQVENSDFITKLMFYDSIKLVQDCDDADFIYLDSEYDSPSKYYCLESSVEKYNALLHAPKDIYTAEITGNGRDYYDVILDNEIASAVNSLSKDDKSADVDCSSVSAKGEYSISVYIKSDTGPFRYALGEIHYKNGEYYWFDYSDIPDDQNNADYTGIFAYVLPDEADEELAVLFDRIYK